MADEHAWVTYTEDGEPLSVDLDLFRMEGIEFRERPLTQEEAEWEANRVQREQAFETALRGSFRLISPPVVGGQP